MNFKIILVYNDRTEHTPVKEMLRCLLLQTLSRGPHLVLHKPFTAVNKSLCKKKPTKQNKTNPKHPPPKNPKCFGCDPCNIGLAEIIKDILVESPL